MKAAGCVSFGCIVVFARGDESPDFVSLKGAGKTQLFGISVEDDAVGDGLLLSEGLAEGVFQGKAGGLELVACLEKIATGFEESDAETVP